MKKAVNSGLILLSIGPIPIRMWAAAVPPHHDGVRTGSH